jgi:hypothetical protein
VKVIDCRHFKTRQDRANKAMVRTVATLQPHMAAVQPPNALFNTACRNCPQRLRLALTVAST